MRCCSGTNCFLSSFVPWCCLKIPAPRATCTCPSKDQAILRGAYAVQANADCLECPAGVSLLNTEYSIDLFAQTLQASCDQVAQIVYNATGEFSGESCRL